MPIRSSRPIGAGHSNTQSLRRTTRSFRRCAHLEIWDRMNFTALDIPDVKLVRLQRFRDARGV